MIATEKIVVVYFISMFMLKISHQKCAGVFDVFQFSGHNEKGASNLGKQAYELQQIMFTFRPARDFL